MTIFGQNMTEFVFVLSMPGCVLNMTGFVLNMNGFVTPSDLGDYSKLRTSENKLIHVKPGKKQ